MRRRPSRLVTATAAVIVAVPVVAGCEAKVYGTPPEPAGPQLTVVAPHGHHGPAAGSPARRACRHLRRPGRHGPGRPPPTPRRPAPTSRPSCSTATPARPSPTATARQCPSPRWSSCSSPTTCCCRKSKGQTQLSPADRSALDAMLRSSDDSAAESVLEPQRRQRDHLAGHRAVRVGRDDDALQRALVQHA